MGKNEEPHERRRADKAPAGRGLHVVTEGSEQGLPAAVEREKAVLSLVLRQAEEYVPRAVAGGISADSWYLPAHRLLWETVLELVERGEPVEMVSLTQLFADKGELPNLGGPAYLAELWGFEPTGAQFAHHVGAVRAKEARRRLLELAEAASEAAYSIDGDPVHQAEVVNAALQGVVASDRGRMSVAVPQGDEKRPRLDVGQHINAIARELGWRLAENGFYRRAETRMVVTVEPNGRTEAMTPRRFRGAVERFVYPVAYDRHREREVPRSLPVEVAATLLETDDFLRELPELTGVAPVRVPVWHGEEVRLCEPGYDEKSGIYCVDEVEYETTWTLQEALEAFHELLKGFDFPEADYWGESRSGMLQVAVMLGTFCTWLWRPGTPKPMVAYCGNQPGTGKTLLASMMLGHVHGIVPNEDFPGGRGGQDELKKILDVAAIDQAPILWFDDVPEFVKNNALNRFVTSSRHKPRVLGKSEKVEVPNVTQVVLTGNHLRVNRDLIRRGLIIELFVPGEIEEREFEVEFSARLLTSPEWRAKSLAACWALVRHWVEAGQVRRKDAPLKGFGDWCEIVGGILNVLPDGAADALALPDLPMGGDEETEEVKRLLIAVARDYGDPEHTVDATLDQIVEVARIEDVQLVDGRGRDIIGRTGDDLPNAGQRKSLGAHLKKWRGRELRDAKGRRFTFGRREQRVGNVYPIRFA